MHKKLKQEIKQGDIIQFYICSLCTFRIPQWPYPSQISLLLNILQSITNSVTIKLHQGKRGEIMNECGVENPWANVDELELENYIDAVELGNSCFADY